MAVGTDFRAQVDAEHERLGSDEASGPIPGQQDFEGGETPAGGDGGPQAPPEGLQVAGTEQLAMFDLGGKQPLSGVLAVKGVKVPLRAGSAFKKGQTVVLELVAVIEEVSQRDKSDKQTGIVVECEQKHVARVTDVRLVESS